MLFVSNVLTVNGGTTFLVRTCKKMFERGVRPGVFVLFEKYDQKMLDELRRYSDVYFLSDYSPGVFRFLFKTQFGVFSPFDISAVLHVLSKYTAVHIMGGFGLLFFARLMRASSAASIKLSVGIYHQNEFMFNSPDFYFATCIKNFFVSINPKLIVFFNENSISNYSGFFDVDYTDSPLLPIGISLPGKTLGSSTSKKIVSVGQLYNFKTYNRHVIDSMPSLLELDKDIVYEIYGEGPELDFLKTHVKELSLQNSVFFKGAIAYSKLSDAFESALVFVGSGTAIIEASACGVPSVIGIESSVEAVTYGFFSNVVGFSYHEYVPGKKTYLIEECIKELLINNERWSERSEACKLKAACFSIDKTVDGLLGIESGECFSKEHLTYSNFRAFTSFFYCVVLYFFKVNREFPDRRDQGTLISD